MDHLRKSENVIVIKASDQSIKHIKAILKVPVIKLNLQEEIDLHKVRIIGILLRLIVECDLIDKVVNQLVIGVVLDRLGAHFGERLTKELHKGQGILGQIRNITLQPDPYPTQPGLTIHFDPTHLQNYRIFIFKELQFVGVDGGEGFRVLQA